jgi:hypothetical protein
MPKKSSPSKTSFHISEPQVTFREVRYDAKRRDPDPLPPLSPQSTGVEPPEPSKPNEVEHVTTRSQSRGADTIDTYLAGGVTRWGLNSTFHGVLVDTGAAVISTGGHHQFLALCQSDGFIKLMPCVDKTLEVRFGLGTTQIIGVALLKLSIGDVVFRIVDAATPFLLGLADMKRLEITIDCANNMISTKSGVKATCVYQFGHLFLRDKACEGIRILGPATEEEAEEEQRDKKRVRLST